MNKSLYVVIKNDGSARVAQKPRIGPDEVAIRLNISWPSGWGEVVKELDVQMPSPPGIQAVRDLLAIEEDLR